MIVCMHYAYLLCKYAEPIQLLANACFVISIHNPVRRAHEKDSQGHL